MPEREIAVQKKQRETDQAKHAFTQTAQAVPQLRGAWDISAYLDLTSSGSPVDNYASLLVSPCPEERTAAAMCFQRTYGNRYVQRLIQSVAVPERKSPLKPVNSGPSVIARAVRLKETEGKLDEVLEVLRVLLTSGNPGPAGWAKLVKGKRWLSRTAARASELSASQRGTLARSSEAIAAFFNIAAVTWENVTPEQRTVFSALDSTNREKVRKAALKRSPLFKAITEMHVPSTGAAAGLGAKRKGVSSYRLREPGSTAPNPSYGVPGSAAATLTESSTARQAIVEPVRAAGGNLSGFANRGLAEWVHYRSDETAVGKLHTLACGMTNLYALALAHGVARASSPGRPPSVADTVAWLKRWTLDSPSGGAVITGSRGSGPEYRPTVILKAISRTGKVSTLKSAFERPQGASAASREFKAFMQRSARAVGETRTNEARLALVQGKSMTHSFIVYKDIDSAWRTMDVYLGLEDLAGEPLGYPRHSGKISAVYFVLNPR